MFVSSSRAGAILFWVINSCSAAFAAQDSGPIHPTNIKGPDKDLTIFMYLSPLDPVLALESKTAAELAARSSGLSYRILNAPYSQLTALAHEFGGCAILPQSLAREQQELTWAGPLWIGTLTVFERDGLPVRAVKIDDLKNTRVGAVLGSAAEAELRKAGISPLPATSNEQLMDQLREGRLDYWLAEITSVTAIAQSLGRPVPRISFDLKEITFGFACEANFSPDRLSSLKQGLSFAFKSNSGRFPVKRNANSINNNNH